ncbi:MAG: citramalate synthase [Candidatus Microthrix sp.]|uniref:Citramalate synthase n=1 Tax=Candidatus Neomicrothrix subdominans TaxID=2954438 RepID=A0A936NAV9_9ACTN|nr:citramalate synthase [Candidatus Microthrix subdominans]
MSEERDTAPSGAAAPPGAAPEIALPERVDVFDTTLRDGSQFEGISLSVDDKLRIAEQLDYLGVAWIEGGFPQANPKDAEFFRRAAAGELKLDTSRLVAFGSTRKPGGVTDSDATLTTLLDAGTETLCIVGKGSAWQVRKTLNTTLDEGRAMTSDSVRYLKAAGRRVFFDVEHCFDGYKEDPDFTLSVIEAAALAGADCVVLCDTKGGSLPHEVQAITAEIAHRFDGLQLGIHTQDDTGCAVANAVAAVLSGATQVQGTINGYGERTGNADLITVIPNLTLKLGVGTLPEGRLERLGPVSRHVAELVNLPLNPAAPYVGTSAFAHKGGLHTSALRRAGTAAYEHVDPALVGNHSRVLVSDLGGRTGMSMKAEELGVDLDAAEAATLNDTLKGLEADGWVFEAADASLELLMASAAGWEQPYFRTEAYRVSGYHRADPNQPRQGAHLSTEATVKVWVGDERIAAVGEGNGPVNALDAALRTALGRHYPHLERIHLTDFKVRVLDGGAATGAVTRVLIDSTDGHDTWTTIGVSPNVIEASWMALIDSLVFGLKRADG